MHVCFVYITLDIENTHIWGLTEPCFLNTLLRLCYRYFFYFVMISHNNFINYLSSKT